jgi:hypothetical protein
VLSGDLLSAAQFAGRFPKAAQTIEGMGSLPQWSPLDLYGGAGIAGIGGALTGSPLSALALTLPLARSGARSAALSEIVQNQLAQGRPGVIGNLLANPDAQQFLLRAAPVAATAR